MTDTKPVRSQEHKMKGHIPVLHVSERLLPEAWEKSVLSAWKHGIEVETEYDRPNDPPSKDCTMMITVKEPFAEPRIHRSLPVKLEDLETYRLEVVNGIHDNRVGEGRWPYSYHQRLFSYAGKIDQLSCVVRKLAKTPYTRRAQAITWIPARDSRSDEPPCLQRLHFRLLPGNDGLVLNMNAHWRSRDAFKAAFMNMWALTDLQRAIAEQLQNQIKQPVYSGGYMDISDSYHIYGKDWKEFERFLSSVRTRPFDKRTWPTSFAAPFFEQAREAK